MVLKKIRRSTGKVFFAHNYYYLEISMLSRHGVQLSLKKGKSYLLIKGQINDDFMDF